MITHISRSALTALALVVLVALSGCAERWSGSDTTPPASTATTGLDPTTTTASTNSTASTVPDSTPDHSGDFDIVTCGEAPGDLVCEAYELIRRHYVDDVDAADLAEGAVAALRELGVSGDGVEVCPLPDPEFLALCEEIDSVGLDMAAAGETAVAGMVFGALDPNSSYFDAESLALITEEQSGQIEGIGALVATEEEGSDEPNSCQIISETCRLKIVSTIEGGPARAADLQEGDEFLLVDGQGIEGSTVDEVTASVRGPAGTGVELTFLRAGREFTITIIRAAIQVPVVSSETVDGVAYVRLNLFTENADEQLRAVLESLLADDPEALVLDMRNNPGGLLDTAVKVTSEFIGEGLVVSTQSPDSTTPYEVEFGGVATDPDLPVFVIVNRGSASASEVVAGALSDSGRATIVGESTFGKNTVQQRFPLSNGGAIKLTIARWFTPDGRDFGGSGITPDVEAQLPESLSVAELVAMVIATT
ncbi:hypothetical protein BH23ACT5_BH23ACT5_19110 [soil metagenome]